MLLQLLPITILPMVLSPSYNDGGTLLVGRDEQEGRMMLFAEHDDDHTNHSIIRNHILTLIGFILLSTLKSIIIGALVGKKCFRTKCCMSRHFLKAWCNSKYRSGSYKHCSWSRFRNKNHDGVTNVRREDEATNNGCTLNHRSSSTSTIIHHHDDEQPKTRFHQEAEATSSSLDDFHHNDSSHLNDNNRCHNRSCINHDRTSSDWTQTSSHAASTSTSSSLSFEETTTEKQLLISSMALQTMSYPTSNMPSRKRKMTKTSLLHLARLQDWKGMLHRLQTCKHPLKEARKRDGDGLLPLHWVCSSPLEEEHRQVILQIVLLLIKVYPQSVCELDMEGNTPLHYLLQQPLLEQADASASAMIQLLLQHDPSSIEYRNIHGHTPLWYACRNLNHISSSAIQGLLQYTLPNSLIEAEGRHYGRRKISDTMKNTSLSMAWKVALKDIRSIKRSIRMQQQQNKLEEAQPFSVIQSQAWKNASLLLCTVYYNENHNHHDNESISDKDDFPMILMATIKIKQTPIEVFDEVLQNYPQLVKTCNSQKNLPLMVALEEISSEEKQRSIYIVNKLLDAFPNAVKIPCSGGGQLPSFVALRQGMTWHDGIERILKLYYDVLWMKDPTTGLYPFMLAAASFENETGNSKRFFSRLWNNHSSKRSSSTASSSSVSNHSNEQQWLMESVFDKAVASSASDEEEVSNNIDDQTIITSMTSKMKNLGSSTRTFTLTTEQQSDEEENLRLNFSKNEKRSTRSSSTGSSSNISSCQETKSRHKETQYQLDKLNTVYELLLACPEAVGLK